MAGTTIKTPWGEAHIFQEASMTEPARPGRMYYIDYLRAFIVILVIVLHSAVAYLSFFPYTWIVVDATTSPACDYVVLASEYFVMAVLFFIAGYLAPPSLVKSGPAGYARSRLQRLGMPFLFGLAVMCPVMTYVRRLARGRDPGDYFTYWLTTYFDGKIYAGYLWFLSTLLIIMLLLCLAYRLSPRLKAYFRGRGPHAASARLLQTGPLLLLALGMGLCMLCINLIVPDSYWVRIGQKGIIIFQPTRLPLYVGFFLWGCIASRAQWRYLHDPDPGQVLAGWAAGSLCCVGAYLALLQNYYMWLERSVLLTASLCLLRALGPLCLTMLCIGFFKAWVNRRSRWKDLVAANSYGMYVAHIPFVVVAQYLLMGSALPGAAKFGLIAAMSLPLSFLCSHFLLRRLPKIGRYF